MKKLAAVAISLLMLFAFVGCGTDMSESKYCGSWEATKATAMGYTMDITEVFPDGMKLVLNTDGSAVLSLEGTDSNAKWEEVEGGIRLDEDDSLTFKDDDGNLILDYSGVTIEFELQK